MNIAIRPVTPDDMRFVLSSWKRTWRVSPWAGVVRNDQYFDSIAAVIEGLIMRGAKILVACPEDRPTAILGWLCSETVKSGETVVHYCYTKDPYLGLQINEKLLATSEGTKPGLYSFRYRQVADLCIPQGYKHAPETARRR